MKRFAHVSGNLYRVMEGVRRAKAAKLAGHRQIRAEAIDASGQSQGVGEPSNRSCHFHPSVCSPVLNRERALTM